MSEKPYRVLGSPSAKKPTLFRLRHGHRQLLFGAGTVTLGRRSTCDYVLDDNQVSREHARIIVGDRSIAIEDLGSANGVLVNDKPIRGLQRVEPGDRIKIGSQVFTMEETQADDDDSDEPDTTVVSHQRRASVAPQEDDWEDRPTKVVPKRG